MASEKLIFPHVSEFPRGKPRRASNPENITGKDFYKQVIMREGAEQACPAPCGKNISHILL
jgi:hypothetical protein